MIKNETIAPDFDPALRWLARIGGGILLTLVAVFFVKNGGTLKFIGLKPAEVVALVALLAALAGLLLGWVSEGVGGILTLAGLIVFTIFSYVANGNMEWQVWLLAVPASLFLAYWWRIQGFEI